MYGWGIDNILVCAHTIHRVYGGDTGSCEGTAQRQRIHTLHSMYSHGLLLHLAQVLQVGSVFSLHRFQGVVNETGELVVLHKEVAHT